MKHPSLLGTKTIGNNQRTVADDAETASILLSPLHFWGYRGVSQLSTKTREWVQRQVRSRFGDISKRRCFYLSTSLETIVIHHIHEHPSPSGVTFFDLDFFGAMNFKYKSIILHNNKVAFELFSHWFSIDVRLVVFTLPVQFDKWQSVCCLTRCYGPTLESSTGVKSEKLDSNPPS